MSDTEIVKEIFKIVKKTRYAKRFDLDPATAHFQLNKLNSLSRATLHIFCQEEAGNLLSLSEKLSPSLLKVNS